MLQFRETFKDGPPLMTMNMGLEGQLSRMLNPVFSPCTHGALPAPSAPGQLTFAQMQRGLYLMGKLPAKKFFLFGTPISASKSPLLHNTAFETLGLPHHYSTFETDTVDDRLREIIRSPTFGGASVTSEYSLALSLGLK
jgi:pentafunctional AROM polypeptide